MGAGKKPGGLCVEETSAAVEKGGSRRDWQDLKYDHSTLISSEHVHWRRNHAKPIANFSSESRILYRALS